MKDQRIGKYVEAADLMNRGQFGVDLPVTGGDEVATLGQALQDLSKTLDRKFEEVKLLSSITQKVNYGIVLEEVLDYVFESFRPIIPYDRIGFSLLTEGCERVTAHWARSDASRIRLTQGYSAALKGSSLEHTLQTRKPRILNDLVAYLADHPQSRSTRLIVNEGMRSSLTCPLIAMSKPIGFMFFSSMKPDTYRDVHVEVFLQIAGQLAVIVEKSRLYQELFEEREKSERLLLNILPQPIAERLKGGEQIIADGFEHTTVLFADLVGFTDWSSGVSAQTLVGLLNRIFSDFDRLAGQHGVEKIKTIGDAYMAVAGLPRPDPDHAATAARMALDMLAAAHRYRRPDDKPMQIRIGMHSGPVVAGIIGQNKFIYDLWGDTVNVASRMESHGQPGRIQLTQETYELLADRFHCEERGAIPIKGKGQVATWFLLRSFGEEPDYPAPER